MNFIRLCTISDTLVIDEEATEEKEALLNNTLEMRMCRVFQSRSDSILEKYFLGVFDQEQYSNVDLNVISSLLYSDRLRIDQRLSFRCKHQESRDLEI